MLATIIADRLPTPPPGETTNVISKTCVVDEGVVGMKEGTGGW